MEIKCSTLDDLPKIFELYQLATAYQKATFPATQWPDFENELITQEINESRQFKIILNNEIACIWAITFSDPAIWEELENNDAIYIHRIATNPAFRGNNFVTEIVSWANHFAIQNNKKYIRMDTCGQNDRLITHYTKSGFTFLGSKYLKDSSSLPLHYQNALVCLFEIRV